MGCAGCKEKNNRCATNYAQCILYELGLPEWSVNKTNECLNLEDTTKELYEETNKIKQEIQLELTNCDVLTFPKDNKGKTKIKEAMPLIVEAVCNLSQEPKKILLDELTECLNWKKLKKIDSCGKEIKPDTICAIFQRLIDEIDALK
jgi:hypothetical protein